MLSRKPILLDIQEHLHILHYHFHFATQASKVVDGKTMAAVFTTLSATRAPMPGSACAPSIPSTKCSQFPPSVRVRRSTRTTARYGGLSSSKEFFGSEFTIFGSAYIIILLRSYMMISARRKQWIFVSGASFIRAWYKVPLQLARHVSAFQYRYPVLVNVPSGAIGFHFCTLNACDRTVRKPSDTV